MYHKELVVDPLMAFYELIHFSFNTYKLRCHG